MNENIINDYVDSLIVPIVTQYDYELNNFKEMFVKYHSEDKKNEVINQFKISAKKKVELLETRRNLMNIIDNDGKIDYDKLLANSNSTLFSKIYNLYVKIVDYKNKLSDPTIDADLKDKLTVDLRNFEEKYRQEIEKINFAIVIASKCIKKMNDDIYSPQTFKYPNVFDFSKTFELFNRENENNNDKLVNEDDENTIINGRVENVNTNAIKKLTTATKMGFGMLGTAIVVSTASLTTLFTTPSLSSTGESFLSTLLIAGLVTIYPSFKLIKNNFKLKRNSNENISNADLNKELEEKQIDKYVIKTIDDIKEAAKDALKQMQKNDNNSVNRLLNLKSKCEERIIKLEDKIKEIEIRHSIDIDQWQLDIRAKKVAIEELKSIINAIDKGLNYIGYNQVSEIQVDDSEITEAKELPKENSVDELITNQVEQTNTSNDESIPTVDDFYNMLKDIDDNDLNGFYLIMCNMKIDSGENIEYYANQKLAIERIQEERKNISEQKKQH